MSSPAEHATRDRLRVLFFVHSLGYLRFCDPVIQELLRRGHAVHLLFERDDHDPAEAAWLDAMERRDGFTWSLTTTLKTDVWRRFAKRTRTATDAARFHRAPFRESGYLFVRAEHRAPRWFRALARGPLGRSPAGLTLLERVLRELELAIPSSARLERELTAHAPDVLVVCPHLTPGMRHSDYVRAARAVRLRSVILVASWDNLSSKQRLHELPDRIVVWNETQADEAVELHGVPRRILVVTGAYPFDRWFGWEPRPRVTFLERVGLEPRRPYVLYVGGALFPAALTEAQWARRWLAELRRHPELASVGVLFRPHPTRVAEWSAVGFDDDHVAIWPRENLEMPIDADAGADFFDSIHHSVAVFGLNTSAMIEAAVVGRPVLTMLAPEFADSQQGVFHFDYLLRVGGGLLQVAESFDELREQVADAVGGRDAGAAGRRERFVSEFIRPRGVDRPAAPLAVEAIEAVAALGPAARPHEPLRRWLLRAPLAVYVRIRPLSRRVRFKARQLLETLPVVGR